MKLQINKDVLAEAVSFAFRVLPQRNLQQILTGILIEADANAVRLSVFDYKVSAQAEVVAKVEESGRALISGRLLSDVVNRLPNAPVELTLDGRKLQVSCGTTNFSLPTMDVDQYPQLPELPPVSGTISGEVLSEVLGQVGAAASKDETASMLTGILLETTKSAVSLYATDRYRIAAAEVPWNGKVDGLSVLVPAKVLLEIAKTFSNATEVELSISQDNDGGMAAFKANNRSVTTHLLKDKFPPVKTIFPETQLDNSVVTTQDLIESTKRIALMVAGDHGIDFHFEAGEIRMDAVNQELGSASDTVTAELTGSPITLSLQPQYLLDGLAGIHSEFSKIGFVRTDNPHRPGPVLITSNGAETKNKFRYLLQPKLLR